MTDTPPPSNAEEISGAISRVNQLGSMTERLFSRLYTGLNSRNKREEERIVRDDLQQKIEVARQIKEKNKMLQIALKERAEDVKRLQGILNRLDEGIIMQDNDGRIVMNNQAARDLLGTMKNFWDSELGMLFDAYRDVDHVDTELAPLGDPTRVQVNGRILGAQLAAVAGENGERLGTMIVLRDVTRDALADRLKDQFVTAISHELKTPMTVIKGMAEVIAGQPEDQPPPRRLLETLTRNVDILDRMVVELLDISEMSAGTFSLRHDVVNLEPLIWSVINGMTPELKRNKLDAAVMPRNTVQLQVRGDDQRLRWALGHLVQNSVRYNEAGGNVMIAAGLDEEDDHYIVIDVIDSGVGISEKDLPHIFERFYRGEPRTSNGKLLDPRGLGQGLFVARMVAESHGGFLRVRSQQGQGSIFTLVLPAVAS